ncbi:hypothetical protein MCHIJ_00500 [Mycolicibacterium chitae]|uniref:hypothetical protein n=1 Tax=Mycolicibacterium chitae TaxID=1792 RepID=UPI00138B3592|nr:hypothetical protein [Mycolicibacterium chitae]BBZ00613.1 hypothetical protein MCHIJ_00500 [Mycolicibacterium chitae]
MLITDRELPTLAGDPDVLALRPLDDDEADQLIRALHPQLDNRARKKVRQRCDGIPLYIEEVVAKVREQPPTRVPRPRCPTPSTTHSSPGCGRAPRPASSSRPQR